MIESPLLKELTDEAEARASQKAIMTILKSRFGEVPEDLGGAAQSLAGEQRLEEAVAVAARCPDLEAFRVHLKADGE